MRDLGTALADGTLSFPLLVAGDDGPAGKLRVRSPFDDRTVGTAAAAGQAHVETALDLASKLARDHAARLSVPERLAVLNEAAALMAERADELALLAASEGGKPLTDSRIEVARAIDGVRLCAEALRAETGRGIALGTTQATTGRQAFTHKEPIGVVVAVSAFNHPLNLIVHQVGPAVAAGCPVIVKPAADTPLSCLNFVEILREAGLPPEWCQAVVTDDNAVAEALVTDARVAFFSFIGSARVGWMLRAKLAPGTRCALEHGGAAPAVLGESADRQAAIAAILKGGFYHAGQVCVSVQRVYAPRASAEELADALAAAAARLKVGDPTLAETEVGPLIRPREAERVAQWVDEAVAAGARLAGGGKLLPNNCYAPTVLVGAPETAKVSQLEVFGPVVCVYGYDRIDDAIAAANALPTAFQAAVFSQDLDEAFYVSRRLDASAVMINDHTAFRDDVMPFAGLRESGLGVGGIPYTFEDMQIEKMTVLKSAALSH